MTALPIWVIQHSGTPPESLFTSTRGLGSPIVINPSDGSAFYFNESTRAVTPLGNERLTYLQYSSDFSVTSSIPVETALKFTPATQKTYLIEGQIGLETSSSSKGPIITLTLPTNLSRGFISMNAAYSTSAVRQYHGTVSGTPALAVTGMPANTPLPATFTISFTTASNSTGDFAISISSEA